jgi:hypothetical protein
MRTILCLPYLFNVCIKTLLPSPMSKLNKGPAIDPDIPISPNPDFANAQFKDKSKLKLNKPGAEFPIAKRVIPRKTLGMLRTSPTIFSYILSTLRISKSTLAKK